MERHWIKRSMGPEEFRHMIGEMGWRAEDLPPLLDVSFRQVQRWLSGETPVPQMLSMLLRIWRRFPQTRPELHVRLPNRNAGTPPKGQTRSRK